MRRVSEPPVDGVAPFALRYFEPAPDLKPFIASFYLFRADVPFLDDMLRADLAQLRFMLSGQGLYGFDTGRSAHSHEICLLGPTMGATHFAVKGPLHVFGVSILPAGWAALIRDDASRLRDNSVDAVDVLGSLLNDALDAMRCALSPQLMVSIANATMRALLARAQEPPFWFTRLADSWLTSEISPQVDALIADSGMSSRQIERLARRIYGAPPKMLARKYRALRTASMIAANSEWPSAWDDAFYDQSHFIREFKQFTGLTPKQFQIDPPPVMRLTIGRRRLAGKLHELSALS
ncbi:AraC family transcriptional regulator [Flavisphingomonas formosensis]|uniref:AraC family transcriptional regulator n=1 Tax=Flavisphingomonas formosensis TaxID=861534 RepID=UPI0012F8486B|nr:helix-turn-helix domain-containing protein [Sphingomonas formosensis]